MDTNGSTMELCIAGVALASILSTLASFPHDVEGWLYGNVVQTTNHTLEDAGKQHPSSTTRYVMKSYAFTGAPGIIYDGSGGLNAKGCADAVKQAKNQGLQVLGWFMARKNSPLRPSQRELAVIRSLSQSLSVPPLFALFTMNRQVGSVVLNFDYRMFMGGSSSGAPTTQIGHVVNNLVSSSHTEYHEFEVVWSERLPILRDLPLLSSPSTATTTLEHAHKAAMETLGSLASQIYNTSKECRKVEQEIRELQLQLNPSELKDNMEL